MKRNLVLVGLVLLGLVIAVVPAQAQVAFQLSTMERNVRAEGTTEAVGTVTLAVTTAGNLNALSKIDIAYGTVDTTIMAGTGALTVTQGGVTAPGTCAAPPAPITACATADNVLTITIGAGAWGVGDSIVIGGVRVDAHAFGEGSISATATATVTAGSPPISFFITNTGIVARVKLPASTVIVTPNKGILTCIASNTGKYTVEIDENFNQAFSSLLDEGAYGAPPAGGVAKDSHFTITFDNVPIGVTISLDAFEATLLVPDPNAGLSLTSTAGAVAGPTLTLGVPGGVAVTLKSAAGKQKLVFDIDITATSTTGTKEFIIADFHASTAGAIAAGPVTVNASVALTSTAAAASDDVPQFVTNVQKTDPAFGASDCITNLLFPWVAVDPPGAHSEAFDTGMAIANTTKDPFGTGGAKAQSGSCKLTGYDATTGAATLPQVIGPIDAGMTAPVVLSTTTVFGAGFRGYVIAVCEFQNAHAFAFLTDDNPSGLATRVASSYLGLVIPSPALKARQPAGGDGSGEANDN
jgi:hypothetical protein